MTKKIKVRVSVEQVEEAFKFCSMMEFDDKHKDDKFVDIVGEPVHEETVTSEDLLKDQRASEIQEAVGRLNEFIKRETSLFITEYKNGLSEKKVRRLAPALRQGISGGYYITYEFYASEFEAKNREFSNGSTFVRWPVGENYCVEVEE
mgnify:CR=1 FL=1